MARTDSRTPGSILGFLLASAVAAACGGGSGDGDLTGPPGDPGAVDSLVLSLDSADVIVGDTTRLTVVARDAEGNAVPGVTLTFVSSDPNVATVTQDGLVTAVDLGEAEIEVGIAGDAAARVESAASPGPSLLRLQRGRSRMKTRSVPKVVITPGEQTLDPGATSQYSASITDLKGRPLRNPPETRWSSSAPSVATIDAAGLVAAVKEGDTRIVLTVTLGKATVGKPYEDHTSVRLHVLACGGITRVAEWDATASATYQATGKHGDETYNISQSSSGTASLRRTSSIAGVTVWSGPVTGNIQLDNSRTFPRPNLSPGVTTEKKSGPIQVGPTAFMELVVNQRADNTCWYTVRYGDYFTWLVESNFGPPSEPASNAVGIAVSKPVDLGPRPAGGWVLSSTTTIPGKLTLFTPPDDDEIPPLPTGGYVPGTSLASDLIAHLGGPTLTYGQASFTYSLNAR